ncbi:TPA: hypothetical protein ACSP3W_000456 [Aeromonas veronii]
MNDHIEVIKTLTIPDYDVEMCIVSVSGELFVKSPDFDTRIPYRGTLDLDDGVIAVIMAEAYETVLEMSMALEMSMEGFDRQLGSTDQGNGMADNREFAEQIGAAVASLGTSEALNCMARVMCWVAADHGQVLEFECDLGVVTVEPKKQQLQS